MTITVTAAHLAKLSNSDFDAEARELLGEEAYAEQMQKAASRDLIIAAILAKQKAESTNRTFTQRSLFGQVDGKMAAAGPDK